MGSKRLKALAVRGHGSIKVAQPEAFLAAVGKALKKIKDSPAAPSWRKGIIESFYQPESKSWDFSVIVRNGQDEYWPVEKREKLVGKSTGVPRYRKKLTACFSCPIGGMPFFEIELGKHGGTKGTGYRDN
jgi:aldehyde:ferredoxin oxidoreductase